MEIHFLTILEAEGLKPRCEQGPAPSDASGEPGVTLHSLSLAPGSPWCALTFVSSAPSSASTSTHHIPRVFSVTTWPSYQNASRQI